MITSETIADESTLNSLLPATSSTVILFKKVVKNIEKVEDDNKKIEQIARLGPDKWLWSTYNHLYAKRARLFKFGFCIYLTLYLDLMRSLKNINYK